MKIVIQKVIGATVFEKIEKIAEIGLGVVIYMGIDIKEPDESVTWLIDIIRNEVCAFEETADILLLSQFTLFAQFKGAKPSFHLAEKPEIAEFYFQMAVAKIKSEFGERVKTGIFGHQLEIAMEFDVANAKFIETKK